MELFKHTSLHCPTRYPPTPGLRECMCEQSALPIGAQCRSIYSAQPGVKAAIPRLYIGHATTEPRCPTALCGMTAWLSRALASTGLAQPGEIRKWLQEIVRWSELLCPLPPVQFNTWVGNYSFFQFPDNIYWSCHTEWHMRLAGML